MDKPRVNDALTEAAEAAVRRADLAKKIARQKRQDKIAKYLGEFIGGILVTALAAYPLMISLDDFGVNASYAGCFLLIGSVRMTIGFLSSKS